MRLQWVHGRRTVVRKAKDFVIKRGKRCFNGSTVGEPWLGQT